MPRKPRKGAAPSPPPTVVPLSWVRSKTVGQVSEIAVMAPIRKGRIPNERRTYEERLRAAIANLQGRVEGGIPTELDKIRTIHFGRMLIIRPEQYLVYSDVDGVDYFPPLPHAGIGVSGGGNIPVPIDDFAELGRTTVPEPRPEFRSWLFTLVEFDGDIRVYFRDIAEFLASAFDTIFRNCEDFPSTTRFEEFWAWIRRYQVESNLFAPRYPDLSVVRIKQLQDFKRRFDEFVANVRSPTGHRVKSMDELFDDFVKETQQYASDFPSPGGIFRPGRN
jgi:hypothetical protein